MYVCMHKTVLCGRVSRVGMGKSSESVQYAITGPCLRMRHRPSAYRTVPIRKICLGMVSRVRIITVTIKFSRISAMVSVRVGVK